MSTVNRALLVAIRSPNYSPDPVPYLEKKFWTSLRAEPTPDEPVALRQVYAGEGRAVLEWVIFKLMVKSGELLHRPIGFIKSITASVISPDIIRALLIKLNPKSLKNEDGTSTFLEQFLAFIGAHWEQAFEDTEQTAQWLRPIFEPLVRAAEGAYEYKPPKQPRLSMMATKRYEARAASEVLLFENLETAQADDEQQVLAALASASAFYSPPAIPSFESWAGDISPLNPVVLERGPTTPGAIKYPYRDLFVWAEIPSPSGIETELELPYEHPVNSIANRDVSVTQALTRLSVNQRSETSSSAGLLPALELTKGARDVTATASTRETVGDETLPKLNLSDILNLPKDSGSSLELAKSPRHGTVTDELRRPLTPKN